MNKDEINKDEKDKTKVKTIVKSKGLIKKDKKKKTVKFKKSLDGKIIA